MQTLPEGSVCRFGQVDDGTLRICCSSHSDILCAHHYARTHFVETDPAFNEPTCAEKVLGTAAELAHEL